MTTRPQEEQRLAGMEHRNKVECYKMKIVDLIEAEMFYNAQGTLDKCIDEINNYRREFPFFKVD